MTTVTPAVVRDAGSTYDSSYRAANSPASTAGVEELDLSVAAADANLVNVDNPAGYFAFYRAGLTDIELKSFDGSTDIVPGTSGTFSFTADLAPQADFYSTKRIDDVTGDFFQTDGAAVAPVDAVPEPATAAAITVVVAAGASVRRRDRRPRGRDVAPGDLHPSHGSAWRAGPPRPSPGCRPVGTSSQPCSARRPTNDPDSQGTRRRHSGAVSCGTLGG